MNYIPVRISTLKPQIPLGFNVYVQLPHKYVLYVRAGGDLEEISIKRFKKKKVKKLFIDEKDEPRYQEFLDMRLQKAIDDPSASIEEKAEAAAGAATGASDKVYEKPGERSSYEAAKKASSGLMKIMRSNDEALKAILNRPAGEADDAVEKMRIHAVNSSSLAIRFGEYLGFKESELEEMGIAALYHDVGFSKMSEEAQMCFFEEVSKIDGKRLGEYKEHPRKAVEILQDKQYASAAVLDLIMSHEERLNGNGFPQKLLKLTPMQEAHALCCHYDRLVTCLGADPKETVEGFLKNAIGDFSLETLKKFKEFMVKMGF